MAIVRDNVLRVGDSPAHGGLVRIAIDSGGQVARSAAGQIIEVATVQPDKVTGEWSIDLPPLDEPGAVPEGAVYRVEPARGEAYHFTLLVAHGEGPHDVANLLTDPPGALDPSGLAVHQGAPDPHPGYATDADLTAHAATSHGTAHPGLIEHDTLGLATQVELDAEAAARTNADNLRQLLSEKGQPSGYASLGTDGKIPPDHLPALAISDTFLVASEAAMLALVAQVGDVAVRSDLNKSFILRVEPATVLGNWSELLTPTDAVQSVQGMTGVVVLPVDGAAGTASLRTMGTGAQQATAGNDARLGDQRVPTDGSVSTIKLADGAVTAAKVAADVATRAELDAVAAAGLEFVPTAPNYMHRPQITAVSSSTFSITDFRIWWVTLPAGTIKHMGIHIATAGSADSRVRGVLYLPDGAGGLPGSLLKDCGQIDTSVAGNKIHTIPDGGVPWAGGPVWAGVHIDAGTTNAALTFALGLSRNVAVPGTLIAQTTNSWGAAKSNTFPTGPAPAIFPGNGSFDQNPPIVALSCW